MIGRATQDMMRHAQYSTTASIYQHVATEDMFAAAQAAQDWIEKALTRVIASQPKNRGKRV